MIVKILNTELEIDFYDADSMEKIENICWQGMTPMVE